MDIADLRDAIRTGRVRITHHADEEAASDGLRWDEIYRSVMNGEVIEDYPRDKPFPSCLVYGETVARNPVHSVWAYNTSNRWAVLITVYRPNPELWINWRQRRKGE